MLPFSDSISPGIIDVAVAVMLHEDGRFLLTQRPAGKIRAGYWEFPGGKIEAGEAPLHALHRELQEELGIEIISAHPWLTRVYGYRHATVRLHFFRVDGWHGEPHGREAQNLSWQQVTDITVAPILPSNTPILRILRLPNLYAISNAAELGCSNFMLRLEHALQNGLRLLQIREKNLSGEAMWQFASRVVQLAHHHQALVLVNSDMELAADVGADGVHLTSAQLLTCQHRPAFAWCSASCHDAAELRHAHDLDLDFAVLSPVLPTLSHPGRAHLGWGRFAEITAGTSIPVYAMGGMKVADLQVARQHGAHGIAMLRQAW